MWLNKRVRTSKELYNLYLRQSEKLCSDGTVEENGTIRVANKRGASLSSENVIAALRARDEAQIQEENRKVAAQAKREKRKAEILQEEAAKQAARKIRAAKKRAEEEAELQRLKARRISRQEQAAASVLASIFISYF